MCFIDALKNRVHSQLWWVTDFKKTVAFAKISANNVRPAMYIMTNLFICTACMPYMLWSSRYSRMRVVSVPFCSRFAQLHYATTSAIYKLTTKQCYNKICVLRQSEDNNNLDSHLDNYYPHLPFECIRIIMGIRWRHTPKKTKLI